MSTKRKPLQEYVLSKPEAPPPGPVTHYTRHPKTGEMVRVETLKKRKAKPRFARLAVESVPDAAKNKRPAVVSVVLEYRAILTGGMEALGKLHAKFNDSVQEIYRLAQAEGITILRADGCMRAPTREENILLIPRKFHMEQDGRHICDTPYVGHRFLTTDESKVTCKLCLRKLSES